VTGRIPNICHFVFGLKPQTEPFHLVHYLCIESCRQVVKPERILFYCRHLPYGPWWDLVSDRVEIVRVEPVALIESYRYRQRGIKKYTYAHHSDFIRLERLLELGGIYADMDTIFVNPIPQRLLEQPFVLGREPATVDQVTGTVKPSLCNAFIMARKDAEFGRHWLEQMPLAFDGSWNGHSTLLPHRLAARYPDLVHVEPMRTFYKHPWTRDGLHTLLRGCDRDFDGVVSMHLWSHLWWSRRRRDFSDFHAGLLTERYVREADTTYNIVARRFLPPPGTIREPRRWRRLFGAAT
jgi:hypothetical protein